MSLEEGSSTFDLESDQLAFKGNEDYQSLLSVMSRLEALREKTLSDLDKLHDVRNDALSCPEEFVRKLQYDPDSLGIPIRPKIPEVPKIDWSKYSYTVDNISSIKNMRGTRGRKINVPEELVKTKPAKPAEPLTDGVVVVRGRVKSDSKPETFNQLWTSEEQRRLEELLVEFPPERVEARRYRKIAEKLGTKTLQQVASRIQKYFIRLAQSGLPVPGRMPNLTSIKRKIRRKHHVKNRAIHHSTFLQAHVPPVFMSEEDDGLSNSKSASVIDSDSESSDSDLDLSDDLKQSSEYRELLELKALRQMKLSSGQYDHYGYKCDGCGAEPIQGTRYHCADCPAEHSVDFCSSCNSRSITLAGHRPGHHMLAVTDPTDDPEPAVPELLLAASGRSAVADKDYLPSKFNIPGSYNYLDPNYMPDSV